MSDLIPGLDLNTDPQRGTDGVPRQRRKAIGLIESAAIAKSGLNFGLMVGGSRTMQTVYALIRKLAGCDVTVFIQGESGTGKELVARALHSLWNLQQPFVAVNCGSFTPELIASELFGHEKGSFSGATRRRRGCFERADGGVLFLDEITEMQPDLQVRLLRVLETQSFDSVGSERPTSTKVRVVAASNQDPVAAVRAGKLRKDLYFRLNAFPLPLPALRHRGGDIPLLIRHFTAEMNRKYGTDWRPRADLIRQFQAHDWPGNVRELQNALLRAYLVRDARENTGCDFTRWRTPRDRDRSTDNFVPRAGHTIAEMEKSLILNTLHFHNGDKEIAARSLGICLKTLYNRLKKYGYDGAAAN